MEDFLSVDPEELASECHTLGFKTWAELGPRDSKASQDGTNYKVYHVSFFMANIGSWPVDIFADAESMGINYGGVMVCPGSNSPDRIRCASGFSSSC